jgi:hypothetical protein
MGRSKRNRFLFSFFIIVDSSDSRIYLSRITMEKDGIIVFLVVDFLNRRG